MAQPPDQVRCSLSTASDSLRFSPPEMPLTSSPPTLISATSFSPSSTITSSARAILASRLKLSGKRRIAANRRLREHSWFSAPLSVTNPKRTGRSLTFPGLSKQADASHPLAPRTRLECRMLRLAGCSRCHTVLDQIAQIGQIHRLSSVGGPGSATKYSCLLPKDRK